MNLSAEQRRAVQRSGQDVCVVAGPGSGKTRVLIERFAWLVEERGVNPARILAITFTEKAATEIKQRLIQRFAGDPARREAIERAWVSTIHGFCARLLREHAIAAGLAPDFSVLDQPSAERLAREAAEESLEILYASHPAELRRLLEALDLSTQEEGRRPDLARSLLSVYDALRMSGLGRLPEAHPIAAAWNAARDLARIALADRPPSQTAKQTIAHLRLAEWAAEFLSLPDGQPTVHHFRLARLGVNVGHLKKDSRARAAAAELKNNVLPRLEADMLACWNRDLLDLLRDAVERIAELYRGKKREQSALDFADLEEESIRLLESSGSIRNETAARFDEILMDEMQDTNRLQWKLLDLIRGRFFAVGDVNQSIYGFRYAEPVVFQGYRETLRETGAAIDDLRENYRSTSLILEAVSRMLDSQPGIEPRPLLSVRHAAAAYPVERLIGRGDEAEEVEASLVAARIHELEASGELSFSGIAVLVRALNASAPFERAFDRFGIPFLVSGGRSFWEKREILDLLALLAALVNPLDEVALIAVLRGPFAGISDEELFRMGREQWQREFEERFGRFRKSTAAPDRILAEAMDERGYAAHLAARARANVEKLLAQIRQEHSRRPRALAELLEHLESRRTMQSEAEAPPAEAGNLVRIMSIHAAKGLEFPVVFVSALHHGPDRRKPVIAFSSEYGLGVKWRNPATRKGVSDTAHAAVLEEIKAKEDAEQNRLLYVAMTRAADRLYLSYAERRNPSAWQKLAEAAIPQVTAMDTPLDPPPSGPRYGAAPIEEILLDAPVVMGQHDSSAAVTAIAQFQACPRKYLLDSLAPAPPAAAERTVGIAAGSAVHRILAGAMAESEEHAELAARFHASELGQRASRASRAEREFDFMFATGDVVLRGQIDLWFEEGGELILVDYKTDRDESAAPAYACQLRLYALALERYAGRLPDRAVLFYLRTNHAIEVQINEADLEEAKAAVREFVKSQEGMEFPMKPGEQCRRCMFYQNRCPATSP